MSPTLSSPITPCSTEKPKVDPLPYSLMTESFVPINERSSCTMLMPRPVPSIFLFLSSSSLWNGVKRASISSSLMPIPVSVTLKLRFILFPAGPSESSAKSTSRATEPSMVYFTAFVRRFITHCLMRISSPKRR